MTAVRVFGHGTDDPDNLINTLPSFERVRASGAEGVELDVRVVNGELVVIHDPVDVRPRFAPTLEQALDACLGLVVNIEIKNFESDPDFDPDERVTDLVLDLLDGRKGIDDDVLISCFGPACLARVKERRPDLAVALLLLSRRPGAELLDRAVSRGFEIVHPYDTMVDAAFMSAAAERALKVNVWTGEDESAERFVALIDLGVDGIITSDPATAVDVRARLR